MKQLILALSILLPLHAFTQGVVLTANGGASRTFVKVYNDDEQSDIPEATIGQFYGLSGQIEIAPKFDLRAELAYERMGYKIMNEISSISTTFTIYNYWDYLKTPISLQFKTGKKWQYTAHAGGYVGYLLRFWQMEKIEGSDRTSISDIKDGFQRFDWGVIGGMGVRYISDKNLVLSLDVRYTKGLQDVELQENQFSGSFHVEMESTALFFGIGYRIASQKKKLPGRGELPKW